MKKLATLHEEHFHTVPAGHIRVPLSVSVLGDFCDYAGGNVIMFATPVTLYGGYSQRDDFELHIRIDAFRQKQEVSIDMRQLTHEHENPLFNVFEAILEKLRYEGYNVETGLNITMVSATESDLNMAIDPTLATLFIALLAQRNDFSQPFPRMARYAAHAEKKIHKRTTSPAHHLCSLAAKEGQMFAYNAETNEHAHLSFDFTANNFHMAIVKQPRFAINPYFVKKIAALDKGLESIQRERYVDHVCELSVREFTNHRAQILSRQALAMTEHVVFENDRVIQSLPFFERKDAIAVGDFMNQTHFSLKELAGQSNEMFDWLVENAISEGALGAKAGFLSGMPVVLVLEEKKTPLDLSALKKRFMDRFDKTVEFLPATACGGAARIDKEDD